MATKTKTSLPLINSNTPARRTALARIRGIWKGRTQAILRENRKIRKEWDKRMNER